MLQQSGQSSDNGDMVGNITTIVLGIIFSSVAFFQARRAGQKAAHSEANANKSEKALDKLNGRGDQIDRLELDVQLLQKLVDLRELDNDRGARNTEIVIRMLSTLERIEAGIDEFTEFIRSERDRNAGDNSPGSRRRLRGERDF